MSIGRELRVLFVLRRSGYPEEGGRVQIEQEEVPGEEVERLLAAVLKAAGQGSASRMSTSGSIDLSEATARLMSKTGCRFAVTGSRRSNVCCDSGSRRSSRIAVPS
jgi:hypothetical protein